MRGLLFCLIVAMTIPFIVDAETLEISNVVTGGNKFIGFNPNIVLNESRNEWLVAWGADEGKGPANIKGRLVKNNGKLGSIKTLVPGAFKIQDLIYDSSSKTYLVLFVKFQKGEKLFVQALNESLARVASPQLISKTIECDSLDSSLSFACYSAQIVSQSSPGKFFVFWLDAEFSGGNALRPIRKRIVDNKGKPASAPENLVEGSKILMRLKTVPNPNTNGNVLFVMESSDVNRLLSYRVNPDGTLVAQQPLVLATSNKNSCCPLLEFKTTADAAFSPQMGITGWLLNDIEDPINHKVKFRKLKANGTKGSNQKTLETSGQITDDQITTYFDSGKNRFVVLWTANEIRGATFNSVTGAQIDPPFTVSGITRDFAQVVTASHNAQNGKTLIVWLEWDGFNAPAIFQIRGLIL